jgi:predicted amidohydrolase/ribosomal protein S18 acetylase RimI-like enzyme
VSNPEVRVRAWREQDIPAVIEVQRAAYPDYPDDEQYGRRKFGLAFATFPEGQLLAEVDDPARPGEVKIVGYATALIVQLDDEVPYTYEEITGHGTFSSHTPAGDTLYGADIAVHPDYQGLGVAQALWVGRRNLMRAYNLRRMLAYGRLLGFPGYAGRLTAREFVEAVVAGELHDRALTAHLRAGYRVIDVRLDLMADPSSLDWATILELQNPDFSPERRQIAAGPLRRAARRMRVCAVQYLMRSNVGSWVDFRRSVEFFVDAADDYHAHLLVFPELFTLQLLTTMPGISDRAAMARLAAMIDEYRGMFAELAQERGLYIIGGSTPLERDGQRYNVGHLFTPSGAIHTQDKLHVTPHERERWGIRPGFGLQVFDTPLGRLAMQICYDIEFPETSRLLTFAGAEVLVVPFSTDERQAYLRVRNCAHARAIENNVYVVLAGNAGNLPARGNLLNYARSAVLTPSDFGFPPEGIAAEADPNIETVAMADLDFSLLAQLREMGSVRPLHDRRGDMYKLTCEPPPKVSKIH